MKRKQLTTSLTTALCLACLSVPAAAIDGPVFTGIGDLPGDVFNSSAYAVSGDGSTVVGWGVSDDGMEAIRWSWDDGIESLGSLSSNYYWGYASEVSEDGSVIVGGSFSTFNTEEGWWSGIEAFRWTEEEGMVGLGDLPGGPFGSIAGDVSADGRMIAGGGDYLLTSSDAWTNFEPGTSEAFLWTEETGMVGLGYLPGGRKVSHARGVSADGAVVVGSSGTPWREAFRWTESTGMVGLGALSGEDLYSVAISISADGHTVVGQSSSEDGSQAFRWTEAMGMVGLGDLPGGAHFSNAQGASGDGTVIVGFGTSDISWEAFVWTESQGMRRLADVLHDDYGLDLGAWRLRVASSISDDGLVIVGYGTNPEGNSEGWVVCLRDECFEEDEDDDDDDHGGEGHQHHSDKGKGHRHHDHEDD